MSCSLLICHMQIFKLIDFRRKKKFGLPFFIRTVPIVPKKITIGILVSIAKEPFMESEKSNWIMTLLLFFYNSVKTPSELAKWSQGNMDFCKASHRSPSSKFCHLTACGFHRQIVFTKDRPANILKFYAYL